MKRIALLSSIGSPAIREAMARTALVAQRFGIEARTFRSSDEIVPFNPDCVQLAWTCQDARLTPFPTYGVLAPPVEQCTRTRRFLRNVLTYDACVTLSSAVRRWVRDLAFGARKFSCPVGRFGASVQSTVFEPTDGPVRLAHVGSNRDPGPLSPVLDGLVRLGSLDLRGPAGSWAHLGASRTVASVPFDGMSLLAVYRNAGAGLDLEPVDAEGHPSVRLLEIIAASAVAITVRHASLESTFGDTLLYVDGSADCTTTIDQVRAHLDWIHHHRQAAFERARAAHEIFSTTYALDRLFPALIDLHARVLVEKGYQPDPRSEYERDLPSATYIIRTGGGRSLTLLRRALDSMVAQHYPKLKALFVLFRPMPEVDQLREEYPQLGIEVVEDFGGLRSTAICAGMRHVSTDFFGLLDDDDVLGPNHVRMLVKALQHHNGRNWRGAVRMAYAGSVEVGESRPRREHAEYDDPFALVRRERRVMEHYRFYSAAQMSQHAWYLINSWLASRTLIDDELLNDPRIHTCEDLYVALQIAQRTFLAFSGEVTMHHCYLDASSTIIDSHRHLADTLRGAVRHWTRLFPAETGYGARLMPLGRDIAGVQGSVEVASNLIGRLVPHQHDRRDHHGDAPVGAGGGTSAVVTRPLELRSGTYRLHVELGGAAQDGADGRELVVDVIKAGDSAPFASVRSGLSDLGWQGVHACLDVCFEVEPERAEVTVRLTRPASASPSIERLLLFEETRGVRTAGVKSRSTYASHVSARAGEMETRPADADRVRSAVTY